MTDDSEISGRICPHCHKPVDPLRAPAVSVVGGRISHFCSSECREQFLKRSKKARETDPDGEAVVSDGSELSAAVSSSTKTEEPSPPALIQAGPAVGYRSVLLRGQVRTTVLLLLLATAALLVPPLECGLLPMSLVGAASIALLVISILRERRHGASRMAEAAATPFAALAILACAGFGLSPRTAAVTSSALLLSESLGRLLELLGRRRSGVLAAVEDTGQIAIPSSWRDNSAMAAGIRRAVLVAEWARYPAACLVGIGVLFAYAGSPGQALLAGATALMAINPRAIRMATGDAHLSAALATSRRGVTVRDAHAMDRMAVSRVVLFMGRRSLVGEDVSVVDWKAQEGINEQTVIDALSTLESGAEGRIAKAIERFTLSRAANPVASEHIEVHPGHGLSGDTPWGPVFCGSRKLLLENGISTALLESHASAIEASGRRALFVAMDGKAVAAFGLEEQPVSGADQATHQLLEMGLEPALMTSAEFSAAHALGARMGIENVRFETPEAEVGNVLRQITATGDDVIVVGHGPVFEENQRSATVALAVGDSGPTQAGVDGRRCEIGIVPWVIGVSRRARVSAVLNLITAGAATLIGLALAAGWFSPSIVVVAATMGFAASAASTWNAPYPMLQRIGEQIGVGYKRIKNSIKRFRIMCLLSLT